MKDWIGPYRLIRRLAESGRSTVYAAEDARLGRRVALKTLRRQGSDLIERERFLREARMAASVAHPGICQVFEVGEADGDLFVAMELLEGETLESRVMRSPLPIREALTIVVDVLGALEQLHGNGLVHRSLHPSSVFLTASGLRLLNFALARPADPPGALPSRDRLAMAPASGAYEYMAPEQFLGGACDPRTDVWAAGALLYSALTARPPFAGTVDEVRGAVLDGGRPSLGGTAGAEFVGHVLERALKRHPHERYATAEAMARDLRVALEAIESSGTAAAGRMTRLIVLPFRLVRPDPEIEFLAFSLSDAISTSLSSSGALIVRSSLTARAPQPGTLNLRTVADQFEVDVVVVGTLLRADGRIRVGVQLLEAPSGTVVWSQARQVPLDGLFELQDDLANGIADSLALPLIAREHRLLRQDVPATPRAYEHYLKANQLAYDSARWEEAVRLYEQCVAEDPRFAPAWARLGRTYRVLAKYGLAEDAELTYMRADAAFKHALELNPDLPVAHTLYAALEVDTGRVEQALTRLLGRAAVRRADATLHVGLVQACRFCGLLDASAAAHAQARRLDPRIQSSVLHTWWAMGEYGRVLDDTEPGTDPIKGLTLATLGRTREAIAVLADEERRFLNRGMRGFAKMMRLTLEGQTGAALALADESELIAVQDPEALYYVGRTRALAGDLDHAMSAVSRAVAGGYFCSTVLRSDPWIDRLRPRPEFETLLEGSLARERRAARVFREAGGEALLGVSVPAEE